MFPWQTFGILVYLAVFVNAWISPQQRLTHLRNADVFLQCQFEQDQLQKGRRNLLATSTSFVGLILLSPRRSDALVKGVAPPPKIAKTTTDTNSKPKCTNVEECQAMAERREQELKEEEERLPPPQITKEGTRFRDIQLGEGDYQVEIGDVVKMYFKVLKLGKRSYDGISGEGTVVFSRGETYSVKNCLRLWPYPHQNVLISSLLTQDTDLKMTNRVRGRYLLPQQQVLL
jgi:hypothetical protein